MLKSHCHTGWTTVFVPSSPPVSPLPSKDSNPPRRNVSTICFSSRLVLELGSRTQRVASKTGCQARRRRVRYDDEGREGDAEYGDNVEMAMLEMYSQSARDEALLVRALVDEEEAEVLIFKGFSSCLSYRTSPDPSRSVLPARAVIKSIDRIRGPFDPSNVEYIEKGLTWDTFKSRLNPNLNTNQ